MKNQLNYILPNQLEFTIDSQNFSKRNSGGSNHLFSTRTRNN
jgi:hypothetical protein